MFNRDKFHKNKGEVDVGTILLVCMLIAFIIFIISCIVAICQPQSLTKSLGGSTSITLPPGQKLEEITWKEDSLWYLTRPMREGETAEIHTFQESSNMGVFEGTVTIIEQEVQQANADN